MLILTRISALLIGPKTNVYGSLPNCDRHAAHIGPLCRSVTVVSGYDYLWLCAGEH
jgi:hypothetical protein